MTDSHPPRPDGRPPPDAAARPPRPAPPQRLARPQPKPQDGDPSAEEAVGSGSATGFVSMLAKRQFDADQLSATAADEAARRDRLQMAHEVERGIPVAAANPPPPAAVPPWYRVMFPLALLMALLLLGIGAWAVGALIYMHRVSPIAPQDVHYPLISWRQNVGNMGGYTPASRFMAWAMLLCVPVAGLLVVLAGMLRERSKPRPE